MEELGLRALHRRVAGPDVHRMLPEFDTYDTQVIRASLRCVLQRRPFTWPAPRNSRGFEPARCRSG